MEQEGELLGMSKKLLIIDNEVFQISIDQKLDKIGDIKSEYKQCVPFADRYLLFGHYNY